MRAFQTALKPSRFLRAAAVILHAAAVIVCVCSFYGWMKWAGLAALGGSMVYAWRIVHFNHRRAVRKIAVDYQHKAAIFTADDIAVEAVLGGSSLLTPYAVFLQWHTGSQTVWQLVLPDMTDKETFRRLYVWARWCQPKCSPTPETPTIH